MTRLVGMALSIAIAVALAGCGKGNEERCQAAIENIFSLTGIDKTSSGPDMHAAVRNCRSKASGAAIDCMIAAKTLEELEKCEGGLAKDLAKDEPAPEGKAPDGK